MDIRNWPIDRIMQLPDWCFGRRWPIIFSHTTLTASSDIYLSEFALPDRCVLWEIDQDIKPNVAFIGNPVYFSGIALNDNVPANAAEFAACENMMPGCDNILNQIKGWYGELSLRRLRYPYQAQGRRVTYYFYNWTSDDAVHALSLIFSSVPTEVPDWLISGPGRSL